MTTKEFLEQAEKISANPWDRVSDATKKLLKKENLVIDIHAHFFDENSVPTPYLQIRFFDWIEKITGNLIFEEIIEKIIEGKLYQRLKLMKRVLPNSQKHILSEYKSKVVSQFDNIVSTAIMVDLGIGWANIAQENLKSIQEHIDETKKLLAQCEPILPFLAIDPRRIENGDNQPVYENFIKAFTGKQKYFGVKFYPAMGFMPADKRLNPIFKICEKKNIPVITHCGGNIICTLDKDDSKFQKEIAEYLQIEKPKKFKFKKYSHRAAFFNHPMHWEPVLEKFPDLRLDLGHFGSIKSWKKAYKGINSNRIDTIERLMLKKDDTGKPKYKHLYTDFSYNLSSNKANKALKSRVETTPIFVERTMFGTDYWMVEPQALFSLNKKINQFKEINARHWKQFSQTNPLNFLGLTNNKFPV